MNTMVMNKSQGCASDAERIKHGPERSQPRFSLRLLARRAGIAVGVAAGIGLLVALIAATPTAVEAIATPPVLTTIELPRVVIRGTRFTPGACPLPTELKTDSPSHDAGAACPVPVAEVR